MKYIFGLGLPRTCTNSLGSALHCAHIDCSRKRDDGSISRSDCWNLVSHVVNVIRIAE